MKNQLEIFSAYLPHKVKVLWHDGTVGILMQVSREASKNAYFRGMSLGVTCDGRFSYDSIMPARSGQITMILRPLSDLLKDEYTFQLEQIVGCLNGNHIANAILNKTPYKIDVSIMQELTSFLLKNHFDIYDLIETRQAISIYDFDKILKTANFLADQCLETNLMAIRNLYHKLLEAESKLLQNPEGNAQALAENTNAKIDFYKNHKLSLRINSRTGQIEFKKSFEKSIRKSMIKVVFSKKMIIPEEMIVLTSLFCDIANSFLQVSSYRSNVNSLLNKISEAVENKQKEN